MLAKAVVFVVCVGFFASSLYVAYAVGRTINTTHTWEIQAIRAKGKSPGTIVMLEKDWEPFGYDREANVVYVRKRVEGGDEPI